jgi:hypothetical protein
MGEIPHPKILAAIALLLTGALLMRALMRRDRSDTSSIRLDDLLIDPVTGKTSKTAAVMWGAFFFTTWLMGYLAFTGKMTEGYFGMYVAGWVTPIVAKMVVDGRVQASAQGGP